jgi:hypothetical protein
MRDLYVNIADPAAALALAEGKPVARRNSALYRTRRPVAGAPIAQASFKLQP